MGLDSCQPPMAGIYEDDMLPWALSIMFIVSSRYTVVLTHSCEQAALFDIRGPLSVNIMYSTGVLYDILLYLLYCRITCSCDGQIVQCITSKDAADEFALHDLVVYDIIWDPVFWSSLFLMYCELARSNSYNLAFLLLKKETTIIILNK